MLFLLSPAKTLDYESPLTLGDELPHSVPRFVPQAAELIGVLKRKKQAEIAELMSLSDALAKLNVDRYKAWRPEFTADNARQAILAFNGDVYEGLQAKTLSRAQLEWAQQHLCILSGLYGLLRPLDWMQAYRLEMGTSLTTPKGRNLYQYWGTTIAQALNEQLAGTKNPVVVNLASQEYFKAVDLKALKARVVTCEFEDHKSGQYKVISFFAKRARGLMARYAIAHRVKTVKALQGFDAEGYAFAPDVSSEDHLVFRRHLA